MEGEDKPMVLITGVTGYVGSQVAHTYLQHGEFKVRGTVRSLKNPEKMEPLKKSLGELYDQMELVEADLLDEESIIKAGEGCKYIVHVASPFPLDKPKHEDLLIKPAVGGTLAACKAAQKWKAKRLVITASLASVFGGPAPGVVEFDDKSWSNVERCTAYMKSKTLAEKAAWDFVKDLPEDEKFEVVVINPGFIIGPSLVSAKFSSGDVVEQIMFGKMPVLNLCMECVDVRDLAKAHL